MYTAPHPAFAGCGGGNRNGVRCAPAPSPCRPCRRALRRRAGGMPPRRFCRFFPCRTPHPESPAGVFCFSGTSIRPRHCNRKNRSPALCSLLFLLSLRFFRLPPVVFVFSPLFWSFWSVLRFSPAFRFRFSLRTGLPFLLLAVPRSFRLRSAFFRSVSGAALI